MRIHSLIAASAATALLSCFSTEAGTLHTVPIAATASNATQETDLVVNGEIVSEAAVRRALVYREGMKYLQRRKMQIFIDNEIDSRVEAGEDRAKYEVTVAEVDAVINDTRKTIKDTYPTLAEDVVLTQNNIESLSDWQAQQHQTQVFNKVFLPDNPSDWTEFTRNAMKSAMPEEMIDQFMAKMQEGYDKRVEEGRQNDPSDPGQMMFKTLMSQSVIQALEERADVKMAADGIPLEMAMIVDGVGIPTDQVFAQIRGKVGPADWESTRLWLAKTIAVRQALKKADELISDAEFEKLYAEREAQYAESPFPLEVLVQNWKKFPSMESYRTYFRLIESYKKMIASEFDDEHLSEHLDRANRLLGLEKVDVEVIWISAYDVLRKRWKENGWELAEKRTKECAQRLADGEDWDVLIEEYSEFWDAPKAQGADAANIPQQPQAQNNKGRFGPLYRNELVGKVNESDFTCFLTGTSVADQIFFNVPTGSYGGPYRGERGYYIALVKNRIPAMRDLSLKVANERDLIIQDYLSVRFNEFARLAMEEADLQGL